MSLKCTCAKAVGVALDHRRRIHPGVGEVTGVETQVEVGVGHQALDLVLELDVAADVRVDDRMDAVPAGDGRDAR